MGLAQTIADHCLATIVYTGGLALALLLVSLLILCIEKLVHDFVLRRKIRKIPIAGPITLKNGRKANVADFLVIKVADQPHKPDVDVKGRENVVGLECPICSKDVGGIHEPSLMVVPKCFHICHTKCFNKKFRHKKTCPSCDGVVEVKDIKEVKITSKPYNC